VRSAPRTRATPVPRPASEVARPVASWPDGFARGGENRAALAALLSLPSLTPRRLLALAERTSTASLALAAVRGTGRAGGDDRDRARELDGEEVLAAAARGGARFVTVDDVEYPASLLDLFDPPAGVFVRGADLRSPAVTVAIVGARNASADGEEVTASLGAALARAGVRVVSGAARGIDARAHQGALDHGGVTVAVLGSGIDVAYPRQNAGLIERIARTGTVVSEYPPGTKALPFRFPARNRIVAGLARAVVIVEGAAGSGSMITADHALELGRDVFAVPGLVTSELAQVPLSLIREGATMIRGAEDLLDDLGLSAGVGGDRGVPRTGPGPDLPPDEAAVAAALSGSSTVDAVAARAGLTLPRTLAALGALEVRGLVRRRGGRYEAPVRLV